MKPVSRKEAAKRLKLYEQGYSNKEIAEICGIDPSSMAEWLKKYRYLAGERRECK